MLVGSLTRELGIGIVPCSPLGRGRADRAISSPTDLSESDHRRGIPWYSEENIDQNLTTLDIVRGIAAELDATPGQVALAWLLAKAPDVVPIPGTRRLPYFDQNTRTADIALTAGQVAALERITVVGDRAHGTAVATQNWFNGLTPAR